MAIITGTGFNDTISAGYTSPNVSGGVPGDGADSIETGSGDDAVEAGGGDDTVRGDIGADSLAAGGGNDLLDGGGGADLLTGDEGQDTLDGTDRLADGSAFLPGIDTLLGGTGNDLYRLGPGDVVLDSGGRDTVETWAAFTEIPAGIEDMVLVGTGFQDGLGNGLANRITGNARGNLLDGGDGADTILGGAGSDRLVGGQGDDSLDGGTNDGFGDDLRGGTGHDRYLVDSSQDRIRELAGEGEDTVTASATFTLPAEVEDLVLAGPAGIGGTGNAGANRITGNAAGNRLEGAGGADTLVGGGGADTLIGGEGSDLLLGGAGGDVFGYATPFGLPDTIEAYDGRQDSLVVSAAGFGGGLIAGMNLVAEGRYVANETGSPDDFRGQLLFNTTTGLLSWDEDGVNDTSAVALAFLPGAIGWSGREIVVIA